MTFSEYSLNGGPSAVQNLSGYVSDARDTPIPYLPLEYGSLCRCWLGPLLSRWPLGHWECSDCTVAALVACHEFCCPGRWGSSSQCDVCFFWMSPEPSSSKSEVARTKVRTHRKPIWFLMLTKPKNWGWQGGPANKILCYVNTCQPELQSWNPHKGRRR